MAKKKNFWKEHWDEVFLVIGILIGLYFILKSGGIDLIEILKNALPK